MSKIATCDRQFQIRSVAVGLCSMWGYCNIETTVKFLNACSVWRGSTCGC